MRTFEHQPQADQKTASANAALLGWAHVGHGREVSPKTSRFGHDFSRIPVYAGMPVTIQTTPTASAPGDMYEQEADRIAAQVMAMPGEHQGACAGGGDRPDCQAKLPGQNHGGLRIKRVRAGDGTRITAPQSVCELLIAPGQPLDPEARGFMEPRFGYDFGSVRVHAGTRADAAAAAMGARAFTVGADVVFRQGEFVPHTQSGRLLLAHELTHVVQQSGTSPFAPGPGRGARLLPRPADVRIQRSPEAQRQSTIPIALLASMPPRIQRAAARLRRAGVGTFGPWAAAVLDSLATGITYRDANRRNHDGRELEVALRRRGAGQRTTPRLFRLRLVLDDQDNPRERAYFESQGERGAIVLNVRAPRQAVGAAGTTPGQRIEALGEDALAELLHHEAVHMFRHWQVTYGADYLPFAGLERSALGLTLYTSAIARIARDLRAIFAAVNAARPASRAVPDAQAGVFAQRLTEEAMVRGETQFMVAMRGRREQAGTGGAAGGMVQTRGDVDRATPAGYLFTFGDMLTPQDRSALSGPGDAAAAARQALNDIALAFDAIIQQHAELRWGQREQWPAYP